MRSIKPECRVVLQEDQLLQYKQVFAWCHWEAIQVVRFVSRQISVVSLV